MGHIADENVGSVINMLIRKSVVMPINGVQNKVVLSPIEFQRRVNQIIFLFFLFLQFIYGQHLLGRLQVNIYHLFIVSFQRLPDIHIYF